MAIPSDVIIVWSGTNASIPSGFTRETGLDGRYPRGCSSSDTTGGNGSVSNSHTHSTSAHTHSIEDNGSESHEVGYAIKGKNTGVTQEHNHRDNSSGSSTSTSWQTSSTDTYHYTVIFMKSNGTNNIPTDAVIFTDVNPSGDFVFCNGASSTPNLIGRYLKGAATGANSGTTGSGYHTHIKSGGHSHAASNSGASVDGGEAQRDISNKGDLNIDDTRHTHPLTFETASPSLSSGQVLPLFRNLYCYQNQGSEQMLDGMIGMWKGLKSAIPSNWSEVTEMRDRYIRNANSSGTALSQGGASTHTHGQTGHTHTVTQGAYSSNLGLGISERPSMPNHVHDWTSQSAIVPTGSGTTTPAYIEVFYIKYTAQTTTVYDSTLYESTIY